MKTDEQIAEEILKDYKTCKDALNAKMWAISVKPELVMEMVKQMQVRREFELKTMTPKVKDVRRDVACPVDGSIAAGIDVTVQDPIPADWFTESPLPQTSKRSYADLKQEARELERRKEEMKRRGANLMAPGLLHHGLDLFGIR